MQKKVLVFSLAYEPFLGGAEIAVKELALRMSDVSFDIVTLRFDSSLPRFEEKGNIRIYRVGFGKKKPTPQELLRFPLYLNKVLFPVLGAFKAFTLSFKNKYSFIWSVMSYMAYPAYFVSLIKKITYVIMLQDGDSIEHVTKRARIKPVYWLLRRAFRKASGVHAISNFLARFANDLGFQGEVSVIPNGVDIKNFSQEVRVDERVKIRAELGLTEKDVALVTSSRLVPKNGLIDVIRALVDLPPSIKFVILGDGELRDSLVLEVQKLSLGERVIFKGFVPHSTLPLYLKSCDIFIRPSLSEGMGSSFVEAMAARLPVIATPVGGITDFLYDPVLNPEREPTGLMVQVQNPQSIAEKVLLLIKDQELRNRIIVNAEKMVRERYDWNTIARDMDDNVFKRVIK